MTWAGLKNYLKNPKAIYAYFAGRGLLNWMSDKAFLKLAYRMKMGKKLNLENPQTFNEKLQWLKIHDRNPEYTRMVDKYEAKKYVAERIGEQYIIPTLGVWDSFDEIDFDVLPDRFVLKCTHDSGGLVICRDKRALDKEKAKEKIERSLARNYYLRGREWPYKNVTPRIIAEEYIIVKEAITCETEQKDFVSFSELQSKNGLLDYKFMCFDGKVRVLFLDIGVIGKGTGHAEAYYRNVYDRDGTPLPFKETREHYPKPVALPDNLSDMVAVAEKLSANIPHLRVDLYRLDNGDIKVGELTFFHGGGFSNVFDPPEWDYTFGSWIRLPEKTK